MPLASWMGGLVAEWVGELWHYVMLGAWTGSMACVGILCVGCPRALVVQHHSCCLIEKPCEGLVGVLCRGIMLLNAQAALQLSSPSLSRPLDKAASSFIINQHAAFQCQLGNQFHLQPT